LTLYENGQHNMGQNEDCPVEERGTVSFLQKNMEGQTMQVVTNRLPRYGIAVLTTAGAALFALFLSPLSLRVPFALFAAAVIISSLEGGLKPGLLATALSTAVLAALYWLLPLAQLPENQGEAVPLLVMFIIVGLMSNYLGRQCWRAVHAVQWVQATLASFGDGLIFTDKEGHVTFMNSVAHSLMGWNQVRPVCHDTDDDTRHPVERVIVRVLSGGSKATVAEPALLVSQDGEAQSVDARAAPICDGDGSVFGAMVLLRNITTSRQEERDLRHREEQFRSLAACAPVGIVQMDPECRCVFTNCSWQLKGGFSAEEGLGEGWSRFLHTDDHGRVVPAWTAAMQAGKEFACEFRFQTPDQSGRWVRLRSSPMFSDVGKVIGHVGVVDDIADHKLAEEALRETRTLLSAVAEDSADALFVKNLQGRYLLTNAAGARMIGKTVKEIIGKDESELFGADVASQMREHDLQVLTCGQAQIGEQGEFAPDSQRAYVTRKSPFRDGRGIVAGLISVYRDVTEEKRLKTELAKVNAALELEVQARQRADEELRQCQARQQSCAEQAAELTRVTSQLQDETLARQRAEERFRDAEAQLRAGETQLADLVKAKAMLQEAVETGGQSLEERSAELANVHASLRDETAARRRAEEALEEYRIRLQALTERTTELEDAKASLEKEMYSRAQPAETLRQEQELLTENSADGILRNGSPETLEVPPPPPFISHEDH
jgi:PAS domain S-box-containing protein